MSIEIGGLIYLYEAEDGADDGESSDKYLNNDL